MKELYLIDHSMFDEFWAEVATINWGAWSKTRRGYEQVRVELVKRWSLEQCNKFNSDFQRIKSALYMKLDEHVRSLGDDSFDDLLSHIIGLGKFTAVQAFNDPKIAVRRADALDFVESFAYCFPHRDDYKKPEEPKPGEVLSLHKVRVVITHSGWIDVMASSTRDATKKIFNPSQTAMLQQFHAVAKDKHTEVNLVEAYAVGLGDNNS